MAKNKNDDTEIIDSMDVIADFEVLDSEKDWRMLSDGKNLQKNLDKTDGKNADKSTSSAEAGGSNSSSHSRGKQ